MPRSSAGFDATYRRHLQIEQRRAVLEVLRAELDPDVTLGEVVDAAEALGYAQHLGEFSLAELADALVEDPDGRTGPATTRAARGGSGPAMSEPEPDDDEEIEEEADEEEAPVPTRASARAAKPARGTKGKKAAPPTKGKKAAPPAKGKKAAKKSRARVEVDEDEDEDEDDGDDRMSLKQAADLLVPIVTKLGKATMEQLERATKLARRKLRFHVGQLVRHGELARHGMGRGTHYTLA